MTDGDLYDRFERMREELMGYSTADPSALRQAARRRTRTHAVAAAVLAAVAVGAIVTAAVAFGSPSPRTPDPIGSTGPAAVDPTPT